MIMKRLLPFSLVLSAPCCKNLQVLNTALNNQAVKLLFRRYKTTAEFVKPHKRKGVIERSRHFVDYIQVMVKGGSGGNGMMSLSSLPNLEWAGPDGGNGGNGGHVIFQACYNVTSLSHLNRLIAAPRGIKGKSRQRDGKNAQHLYVKVPLGTVVKSEDGHILASLDNQEDIFIAARGGAGGRGNYSYLSNDNRAPITAEKGGQGQERELHVELKTMAHAGFIGFPNAGKSSLLRAISRAQPKVSPYPFTTLNPHIGMVLYDDHTQLAVADIPGLIPGSHMNKGMGHSFLRHIERCLCLVYVIDLSLEEPWHQLMQLHYELNQYKDGLADRPSLLVANKIDLPGATERFHQLKCWMRENKKRNNPIKCDNCNNNENINKPQHLNGDILYDSPMVEVEPLNSISGGENIKTCYDALSADTNISKDSKYDNNNIEDNDDILVFGVSSKYETGIPTFLHHLRVIYDSHLVVPSTQEEKCEDELG